MLHGRGAEQLLTQRCVFAESAETRDTFAPTQRFARSRFVARSEVPCITSAADVSTARPP